jgi:hypothetical protein
VVRGGAWNNNQDNARATFRNHNDPNNRNNEIGVRLVCLAHIFAPFNGASGIVFHPTRSVAGLPTVVGTGSASSTGRRLRFPARGEGLKMAQVGPVRTESPRAVRRA